MKQIFLLTLIAICCHVSAQPYKSIFGKTSTMWIIKWYNLDFGGIDTFVVEKDTFALGDSWKKIISTNDGFLSAGLLREDTLIGKVWYRPLDIWRDSTYLAFDYSLQTSDTFDLSSNYDPWLTDVIVDSTYFEDGNKRIRFNAFIEDMENITFIEGIGGNQGPIYKESSGFLHPYLLCAYKDGIQTYANISYNEDCSPPTGINETDQTDDITVYPNPIDDGLYIRNLSDIRIEKVEVFDALGRKVYSDSYLYFINFQDMTPGLYYLKLITDKGQNIVKSVMRK